MRVLFDNQIFSWQKFGGISRYIVELTKYCSDVDFKFPITLSDNIYLKNKIQFPNFKGKNRLYRLTDKCTTLFSLHGDFDIFHPTYYDPYFLRYLRKPYVITVHDMIHEKFVDQIKDYTTIGYKRKVITKANKIIAISENTKKDIIDIYGINEDKISVIYHGFTPFSNQQILPVDTIPSRYILYVGQRDLYKNFDRFLRAFALVKIKHSDIKLLCTGSPFNMSEKELIQSLHLNTSVVQKFVDDFQLKSLYQNALCFVYPSLYEGFGMPILEAFAAQCPVVLSETSCFPEIARDGAIYFDPYEIDSIATAMLKVVEDSTLQNQLVKRGKHILGNYSWNKTATETTMVYKSLM